MKRSSEAEQPLLCNETENIWKKLKQAQDTYFLQTKKIFFVKKQQKFDCAAEITRQFDITALIEKSVFILPETNCIYMDYPVFKMFAHPDNYSLIVQRFVSIINGLILQYGTFVMHLNLHTFTVSAAERYLPLIKLFCAECAKDTTFSRANNMEQLYTYNTPSAISSVLPVIYRVSESCLQKKITHYSKEESGKLIEKLLHSQ